MEQRINHLISNRTFAWLHILSLASIIAIIILVKVGLLK